MRNGPVAAVRKGPPGSWRNKISYLKRSSAFANLVRPHFAWIVRFSLLCLPNWHMSHVVAESSNNPQLEAAVQEVTSYNIIYFQSCDMVVTCYRWPFIFSSIFAIIIPDCFSFFNIHKLYYICSFFMLLPLLSQAAGLRALKKWS